MNIKYNVDEDKQMNDIPVNNDLLEKTSSNYYSYDSIDEKSYKPKKISSGSYGKIYKIKNKNKEYILKKPIGTDRETMRASDAESKITSIISSFQHHYLKKNSYFNGDIERIIPKVYTVYTDKFTGLKNIIMEKLDGDVYDIFQNLDVRKETDKELLIELLYQISSHLYLFQKYFQFMHNDLKQNNILYKLKDKDKGFSSDNIIFILTDFGGSTMNFNKNIIKGEVKGNELYFDKGKDIYLLVHMLITYINSQFRDYLINFLKTIFNYINTDDCLIDNNTWHNLYQKKEYPEEYHPFNLLINLNNKFCKKKKENIFQFLEESNLNSLSIVNNSNSINKYTVTY